MIGPRNALGIALRVCALGVTSACSLVLDFDTATDAAPPDSPATEAQCGFGEPNDSTAMPTDWNAIAAPVDAAICGGGDLDNYLVTITDGQTLAATITFMNRNGSGDLDLRLLSASGGTVLDESRGAVDTEDVMCPGGLFCPTLAAGDYLVEVRGFADPVISPYALTITRTP